MFKRKLVCSFCRRTEAEVAKLVAGPRVYTGQRVYICDRCAVEAVRIMNESDANTQRECTAAGEIRGDEREQVNETKNLWMTRPTLPMHSASIHRAIVF
jgi:ATP-dependent protease Clp ATPase subunit